MLLYQAHLPKVNSTDKPRTYNYVEVHGWTHYALQEEKQMVTRNKQKSCQFMSNKNAWKSKWTKLMSKQKHPKIANGDWWWWELMSLILNPQYFQSQFFVLQIRFFFPFQAFEWLFNLSFPPISSTYFLVEAENGCSLDGRHQNCANILQTLSLSNQWKELNKFEYRVTIVMTFM